VVVLVDPVADFELVHEFILTGGGCLLLVVVVVAVDTGKIQLALLGLWLGLRSMASLESGSSYWHVWKTLFMAILI